MRSSDFFEAVIALTMSNNDSTTGDQNQTSDGEFLVQFLTQNKVLRGCANELVQRGFTSCYALALAEPEDLQGPEIPTGQQRLISHLVKTLRGQSQTTEKDSTTQSGQGPSQAAATTTGTALPTSQTGHRQDQSTSADLYGAAIMSNMMAQQQELISAQPPANSFVATPEQTQGQHRQPSWNDPQIHLSTATGKSVTDFYDICDFVQGTVEEETIISEQGVQQLVFKSGPKKPRLENLTLSQWSIANLAILYKLSGENKLGGPSMLDYLSYTTKVYQLVQRFSLMSVLLYDREYRKLQAQMGFRWGTDVQHLHTLCLQPRDKQPSQGVKKPVGPKPTGGKQEKPKRDSPICRNFNSSKGCTHQTCSFRHECIVPGCGKKHTVMTHMTEKN